MFKVLTALYSALCYVFFLAVFVYSIGFVEGLVVPKTIDSGAVGALVPSLVIDALLLGLFAVQHTIMARPAFKKAWTRLVPWPAERSTFVLAATVALALICLQWRPLPQPLWTVANPMAANVLIGVSLAGWGAVLLSTFLINHFELFGLTQGLSGLIGRETKPPQFVTPLFYRWVRHPIYVGFIVAFWSTPRMTLGHLVFAVATTGYILVGIWFEERDLVALFGDRYRLYRQNVGMLLPKLGGRGSKVAGGAS
jgi:protein-S-isoprenylcysteine O-methyltransferase Ste14